MSDDLVQRLRAWEVWELDKGPPPPPTSFEEAANRINELEKTIWTMHGEAHEHIKHIEALEAALRELAEHETSFLLGGMWYRDRARRALEGKP